MDLGCGQGLLGIYCAKKNAKTVHFTDYNCDVIDGCLAKTVNLNKVKNANISASSGDWAEFGKEMKNNKFDFIVTSETIYNEQYYSKLHTVLKTVAHENTIIYVAAKRSS